MLLKTKMRSYSDEATDFHDKEVPKVGSNSTFFLAAIILDCAYKKEKKCYLKVFLKEFRYIEKNRTVITELHITEYLGNPSNFDESYEEWFFFNTHSITCFKFLQ